jgi:hypothetical protein
VETTHHQRRATLSCPTHTRARVDSGSIATAPSLRTDECRRAGRRQSSAAADTHTHTPTPRRHSASHAVAPHPPAADLGSDAAE